MDRAILVGLASRNSSCSCKSSNRASNNSRSRLVREDQWWEEAELELRSRLIRSCRPSATWAWLDRCDRKWSSNSNNKSTLKWSVSLFLIAKAIY